MTLLGACDGRFYVGSFVADGVALRAWAWREADGWAWDVRRVAYGRDDRIRHGWCSRRTLAEARAEDVMVEEGRKIKEAGK